MSDELFYFEQELGEHARVIRFVDPTKRRN